MKNLKWCWSLVMVMLVSVLLLGCGSTKTADSGKAGTDKMTIVTSFYPMYLATINITKNVDGVEVLNMTKPQTGCLHDYQLTPEDLKTLETADAFVVNGAGMETFLAKVVKQQKNLKIIEASKNINLLKNGEEENPHVWVSVSNAIVQANNIAEQLAAIDTKHAAQYLENAAAYINKLEALKLEMHQQLDNLSNKNIVTFHEAFPYFADEFKLNIVAVIEREPGSEPSPRELEAVIEKIKLLKTKALFAEPQYPAGAAELIAKESGGKVYTLDPVVTGEANSTNYDAYIKAMQNNLQILKQALQ